MLIKNGYLLWESFLNTQGKFNIKDSIQSLKYEFLQLGHTSVKYFLHNSVQYLSNLCCNTVR